MPDKPARAGNPRRRLLICVFLLVLLATLPAIGLARNVRAGRGPSSATRSRPVPSSADKDLQRQMLVDLQKAARHRRATAAARRKLAAHLAAQRLRSRSAYRGQTARGAIATARAAFADEISQPPIDPTDALEGLTVKQLDTNSALVAVPGGKQAILESAAPIATSESNGKKELVSLDLDEHQSDWTPSNPLTDYSISKSPVDGVVFPGADFSVSLADQNGDAPKTVDGKPFFANVQQDTDLWTTPLSTGVESFFQLRSPASPTEFRMHVQLGPGEELLSSQQPFVAAVIVKGSTELGSVSQPTATDAQGHSVDVSATVDGSDVVITVDHDQPKVAYPVLVDPEVRERFQWYIAHPLDPRDPQPDGWQYFSGGGVFSGFAGQDGVDPHGPGLYSYTSTGSYPAGAYGQWTYTAPGTGYIYRAEFGNVVTVPGNNNTPPVCSEEGVFSWTHGAYETGRATPPNVTRIYPSPWEKCAEINVNDHGSAESDNWIVHCLGDAPCSPFNQNGSPAGTPGNTAVFKQYIPSNEVLTVHSQAYLGDAWVFEYDVDRPFFTAPPADTPARPTGWVKSVPTHTVTATARDTGMGVASEVLAGKSTGPEAYVHPCTDGGSVFGGSRAQGRACPATWNGYDYTNSWTYGESTLREGTNTLSLTTTDIIGNASIPNTADQTQWQVKLDKTPPTIGRFSGDLVDHPGGARFSDGMHELDATITDDNASHDTSGICKVTVMIDGKPAPEAPWVPTDGGAACAQGQGSTDHNLELHHMVDFSQAGAGFHVVSLKAEDGAGNVADSVSDTNLALVWIAESDTAPIGPGSVNLTTGNFAVSRDDAAIDSPLSTLTFSRTFNSRAPDSKVGGAILGPGWVTSEPVDESSSPYSQLRYTGTTAKGGDGTSDGTVLITESDGTVDSFRAADGDPGQYTAPPGYDDLTLERHPDPDLTKVTFVLKDSQGDQTVFAKPSGGLYHPTEVDQANDSDHTTIAYDVFENRPMRVASILADPPAGATPGSATTDRSVCPVGGARELVFNYADDDTPPPGENSPPGDYPGQLSSIEFRSDGTCNDPPRIVAQYAYDHDGRLRSESDPRTGLKETYDYDSAGHVSTITPPGLQAWNMAYTTTADDKDPGRLKSVTRGAAPALVQAESFTDLGPYTSVVDDPDADGGRALQMLSSDVVTTTVTTAETTTGMTLRAKGDQCDGAPEAVVKVDGEEVLHATVSASGWTDYSSATSFAPGTHTVTLTFPNDFNDPGTCDRNLLTDKLSFNFGGAGGDNPTTTVHYGVPTSGSGAPYQMDQASTGQWGQTESATGGQVPDTATAIFPPDQVPADHPADYTRATIHYLDAIGREVNTATPGGNIGMKQYDDGEQKLTSHDNVIATLTPRNRERAKTSGTNFGSFETLRLYSDDGIDLIGEQGPVHAVNADGSTARTHTVLRYDQDRPSGSLADGSLPLSHLLTSKTEYKMVDSVDSDGRTTTYSYSGHSGDGADLADIGWKFGEPTSVTTPGGLKTTTMYDSNTGLPLETIAPKGHDAFGNPNRNSAYDRKTTLYASGSPDPDCDTSSNGHPEHSGWVNLPCKVGPAAQPTASGSSSYSSTVSGTAGLVSYWRLGETSGTAATDQKGAHNGTYTGSTKGQAGALTGDSDTAVKFNVSSDKVDLGGWAPTGTQVSLEFWAKDNDDVCNTLFDVRTSSKQPGASARINCSGHVTFDVGNGNATHSTLSTTTNDTDNAWHHYVLTYDGSTEKIYRDGSLSASHAFSTTLGFGSTPHMYIAHDPTGGYAADITIDEVAVYNTTLSAATVSNHYSAGQTSGPPAIPTTKFEYNDLNEPTRETETAAGADVRVTQMVYDSAGRTSCTQITSGPGQSVPATKTNYSSTTGEAISTQSASSCAPNASVSSEIDRRYDSQGRMTGYSDADTDFPDPGWTSQTTYDIDGRPVLVSNEKGSQRFCYDGTTGLLTELHDSALGASTTTCSDSTGAVTATYNADGKMTTESMPNGLQLQISYDETGQVTDRKYTKDGNTWLDSSGVRSAHYQLTDVTTTGLSSQHYTYDFDGRLVQTQDLPDGHDCITRNYNYDTDTNRTSSTVYTGSGSNCTTSGGTTTSHTYDEADRLTDATATYDTVGRMTTVPAQDAGAQPLSLAYYANDMTQSMSQNGATVTFSLDPDQRDRVVQATSGTTETDHFGDDSDSPIWTQGSGLAFTRNIQGIDGDLLAIQDSSTGVQFQLMNLHGDVVATASGSATAPSQKFETDEFGIPRAAGGIAQKYGYLGSKERAAYLPSGVIQMGERAYVPEMGRFTSTDRIPGASANPYDYVSQDPVNQLDLNGETPDSTRDRTFSCHSHFEYTVTHPGTLAEIIGFSYVQDCPIPVEFQGQVSLVDNGDNVIASGKVSTPSIKLKHRAHGRVNYVDLPPILNNIVYIRASYLAIIPDTTIAWKKNIPGCTRLNPQEILCTKTSRPQRV